jgi:hypothetical protein
MPSIPHAPSNRDRERFTGQALIDAFAEIRGLLTHEEMDRISTRNPSAARTSREMAVFL